MVHGTIGVRFTPDGKSLLYGRAVGTLLLARNPFAVVEPPVLSLSLEVATSTVDIAWPGNDAFVLQAGATMEPASWQDVPESSPRTDTGLRTTLPISDVPRFYRLRAE